ncbi:hypothetical protein IWQ60_011338 [Tieghemiomyces parasiticus]|uniref:Proteasome assembly chaperone 2 n=1 Tax=Tieghemiomyces parasiticus TaxID=78921 RepID=A0A9W7ZHD7_9FUNG|nr:hypothetical protein IWQ60_011338 [Tieghemiomyces parasiticus]
MNHFTPEAEFDPKRFQGSELILPCVSIGNVPQLSCDLIISTLRLDRVGYLTDPNVTPMVGPPAFDHIQPATRNGLTTALEVFQSVDGRLTVVQQRAPALPHRQRALVDNLARFIADGGFQQVVLLSTVDARLRDDKQLVGSPFRYLPTTHAPEALVTRLEVALGVPPLESELTKDYTAWFRRQNQARGGQPRNHRTEEDPAKPEHIDDGDRRSTDDPMVQVIGEYDQLTLRENQTTTTTITTTNLESDPTRGYASITPKIPGGGMARQLHRVCQRDGLPLVVLLEFVAEGDNVPESVLMANCLNGLLDLFSIGTAATGVDGNEVSVPKEWTPPPSWHSFYSTRLPQVLYQ